MIDTHCHLNFHSFKKDYRAVAQAAFDAGVTKIINVGAKLDSSRRAVQIANEIPFCFAAVGVHPHHADEFMDLDGLGKELSNIIEDDRKNGNKIIAIGECGLDYHEYAPSVGTGLMTCPMGRVSDPPLREKIQETQVKLFKLHLLLAQKFHLPLILHCRDAYSDLLNLLQTANCKLPTHAVIHCFQGSLSDLKQFLDLGLYVGYDGYITYPPPCHSRPATECGVNSGGNPELINTAKLDPRSFISKNNLVGGDDNKGEGYEELVHATPLNRILTETDSPWLTPIPLRGKRNTPANIKIICEKIAEIKKLSLDKVNNITVTNSKKIFTHLF